MFSNCPEAQQWNIQVYDIDEDGYKHFKSPDGDDWFMDQYTYSVPTKTSTLTTQQIDCDGKVTSYEIKWEYESLGYESEVLSDTNGQICAMMTSYLSYTNNPNPKAYLVGPSKSCAYVKDGFLELALGK